MNTTMLVQKGIPITNQTYYTFTMYWSNFGLTDLTENEYTI